MTGFWKWVEKKWHYWAIVVLLCMVLLLQTTSFNGDIVELTANLIGVFIGSVLIIALFYWTYFKLRKRAKV